MNLPGQRHRQPSSETPTSTPTPEATPEYDDTPRHYKGSGDKLIPIEPMSEVGLITVVARGRGGFLVQSVDASGDDAEMLAQGEGGHRGTRMYNLEEGEAITALRVTAQGSWKITLSSVQAARIWSGLSITGFGDDVLYLDPVAEGSETIKSKFVGESFFAVEGYEEDGSTLLASEIDTSEVEEALPDGTFLVTVEGDGAWTLQRSGRRRTAAGLRTHEGLAFPAEAAFHWAP